MKKFYKLIILIRSQFRLRTGFWLALAALVCLGGGCQEKPAPLSPAASSFRHEIKTCLTNLSTALMEPVAKKDMAAINAALATVESPAVKLCRLCPFQVGVLNRIGEALAIYPAKAGNHSKNYSSYDLINRAITSRKIQQQRFYLQNGSELYIVCAPLVQGNIVIGLVAIAVNSEDAARRWNLTEKEFLSIDFNT